MSLAEVLLSLNDSQVQTDLSYQCLSVLVRLRLNL